MAKISFVFLAFIYARVESYSSGPPLSACDSMKPGHGIPPQNNYNGSVPTICELSASKIVSNYLCLSIFKSNKIMYIVFIQCIF